MEGFLIFFKSPPFYFRTRRLEIRRAGMGRLTGWVWHPLRENERADRRLGDVLFFSFFFFFFFLFCCCCERYICEMLLLLVWCSAVLT